jgi:site-specific recombinase XerD
MKARFQGFHSPFASAIERYLAVKRALNRRFDNEERSLRLFDRYLVEQNVTEVTNVTAPLVAAFMVSRPRTRPRSYNHLLCVLRQWFGWMVQQGDIAVAPSLPTPRRTTSQYVPFLFDQTLAKRLLEVTAELPDQPKGPARAMTYRMIFVLLYGLGLRVGEVSRLRCDDVDLRRNLLVVRESKFGKSRWVPFGPKVAAELIGYLQQAQHRSWRPDSPLFSFNADRAVNPMTVSQTFHHLLPSLHLEIPPGVASPRLHHLRHSFAVGTLLRWYRSGIAPGQRLLRLSTFMGHIDPASTAVYLTITSDLLNVANERFEQYALHGGHQR